MEWRQHVTAAVPAPAHRDAAAAQSIWANFKSDMFDLLFANVSLSLESYSAAMVLLLT